MIAKQRTDTRCTELEGELQGQTVLNEHLKDKMKEFTTLVTYNDADETFERVLREEFQLMRKKFEQKVEFLKEEVRLSKLDLVR